MGDMALTSGAESINDSLASLRGERGRLKRVLFALDLSPRKFGGLEELALARARAFRDRGGLFLPVFFPPLDTDTATQYASEGLRVEAMDLRRFRLATLRRLLQLIRRDRIEVAHWNFYAPLSNGYVWGLSVLAPGVQHYFTERTSRSLSGPGSPGGHRWKWIVKWPLEYRYRKTFCVSQYVMSSLEAMHWPNLQVLYHCVNTERFRPDPAVRRQMREAMGIRDEFIVLFVAYLLKEKGGDVALRALAELPANVVLWIVGDGPEWENLQALASDLDLEPRVRFLGRQRNVASFMQAADCLICPSVWAEAAGWVNVEGQACGIPVIASRTGGIPELVADGKTGYLFPPGDHRELADRVNRLLGDKPARRRMGQQARSLVLDRFS